MALTFFEILKELLLEAKQVGNLYHFTSYRSMLYIIGDDFKLQSKKQYAQKFGNKLWGATQDVNTYISFTRDKRFDAKTDVFDEVRIMVDGNKMSNKYKIEPFSDREQGYGRGNGYDEMEERVLIDLKKYPSGLDIKPYLLSIDIRETDSDSGNERRKQLIKVMNSNNISFNYVKAFR